MTNLSFKIRCRGIIQHEGKLLLVRHTAETEWLSLPGGHLEWGENIIDGMKREIVEELGIIPEIGRLLYINTYIEKETQQPVEFLFEVTNGADFLEHDCNASHAHELHEVVWVSPKDEHIPLRPEKLLEDFKNGILLGDGTRFIPLRM